MKKLNLKELQVNSFVTSLENEQKQTVKILGGDQDSTPLSVVLTISLVFTSMASPIWTADPNTVTYNSRQPTAPGCIPRPNHVPVSIANGACNSNPLCEA